MRTEGLTLLFVSHDMGTVRDVCQRALYLQSGIPVFFGDTSTAIRLYMNQTQSSPRKISTDTLITTPQFFEQLTSDAIWSGRSETVSRLVAVHIRDMNGHIIDHAKIGETVLIQACYLTTPEDESLTISLAIKNRYDQTVISINSKQLGIDSIVGLNECHSVFEFEVDFMLEAGFYSLKINISSPLASNRGQLIDTTDWFGPFQIQWDYEAQPAPFLGMFGLPTKGRLK